MDAKLESWLIRLVSLLSSSYVTTAYYGLQRREVVLLVAGDEMVQQRAVLYKSAQ
jgi:hypothetical protein